MAKKIKKEYTLEEWKESELPVHDKQLVDRAKSALEDAYAPYSGFRVGAAIALSDGHIVTGNNQENAAYPSGLCAERVAVFHVGSNYPDAEITSIAIAAKPIDTVEFVEAGPCGSCRQVLIEYQNKQETPIYMLLVQSGGNVLKVAVNDLLPLRFDMDSLLGEGHFE